MTETSLFKSVTLGALAVALAVTAMPAEAEERGPRRAAWSQSQTDSADGARGPRQADRRREEGERRAAWRERRGVERRGQGVFVAPPAPPAVGSTGYAAAPRNRGYGATSRAERREDRRDERRTYRDGYRQGQREDWRDDRRDERRAYERGYRAGDRADDRRWSGSYGHWDNRAWRNDQRYDWYRHRAANRAIFSPGRYYAPYRDYRYNRLSIGFRIGSPFYASRYWIMDPWRYRLPSAYGPYRWVRYYDDALLVDIYSGRVVDVIHDFFW
ncbi:RcnB family protein [Qipengyuania sediminis]|uniref:RcnB family protein n=1 Tax=Qipengyuania sediminis TaxID=1532023 RepID=UPI001F0D5DCD|nr:RcnB family protein [Qipengyuania sediminis]